LERRKKPIVSLHEQSHKFWKKERKKSLAASFHGRSVTPNSGGKKNEPTKKRRKLKQKQNIKKLVREKEKKEEKRKRGRRKIKKK